MKFSVASFLLWWVGIVKWSITGARYNEGEFAFTS